ncbi:MAG: MotA/TolQ/ExbB proton channel family protein [Myxococcales bacterium]|nr:MotA/TolQ/ExbB proton channel family protein [Myxococcales bacterium]
MDAQTLLTLLSDGGLTVYPLGIGSVVVLGILVERMWRFRGIDEQTRGLTRETVDALVKRDVEGARRLCEASNTAISDIYLEAMRWKNIALEDLERIMATSRQETVAGLSKRIWVIGTIGSLAPYVGLFGTVIGIIRAFQDMAEHGAGGFDVVAAGISEALVATGAGLFVAIIALLFFNILQVRVGSISKTYARSCERFVQALLYVESSVETRDNASEVADGRLVPA